MCWSWANTSPCLKAHASQPRNPFASPKNGHESSRSSPASWPPSTSAITKSLTSSSKTKRNLWAKGLSRKAKSMEFQSYILIAWRLRIRQNSLKRGNKSKRISTFIEKIWPTWTQSISTSTGCCTSCGNSGEHLLRGEATASMSR